MNTFWFKVYGLTVVPFLVLDLLWLGLVARNFYFERLGRVVPLAINRPAALAFYLLFVAGIVFFAVAPALAQGGLRQALFRGALFGLFTYATYDLTNLSTIEGWPLSVTVVDILWGMVLCGNTACLGYLFGRWLQQG